MPTDRDIPRQAGVLPYRRSEHGLDILLVTSSTRKRWIIPKGNIESQLGELESARQEAFEEAGIRGSIRRVPIGSYVHVGTGGPSEVIVYAMEVQTLLNTWPEACDRRREWMRIQAARDRILEPDLQRLLLEFAEDAL
ncbi:MAG: NUDIX hydrolase [Rhodothermales bacterium]